MATSSSSAELLRDNDGSAQIGWVAPHVLLARFDGSLSANLGNTFVNHLQQLVSGQRDVCYFGDASRLKHYDMVARSAFVRMMLSYRRAFASIMFLMPGPQISVAERALASAVGEPLEMVLDASAFEAALALATQKNSTALKRRG